LQVNYKKSKSGVGGLFYGKNDFHNFQIAEISFLAAAPLLLFPFMEIAPLLSSLFSIFSLTAKRRMNFQKQSDQLLTM
jgi:hypothetical protein